jgi:hypothetical protein
VSCNRRSLFSGVNYTSEKFIVGIDNIAVH